MELAVRRVIAERLTSPSRLPSHVQERVKERIQVAARKNPAVDSDYYASLPGQLEYFDFRELQDTITNKALWPEFENCFGTKEALIARFDNWRGCATPFATAGQLTRSPGRTARLRSSGSANPAE